MSRTLAEHNASVCANRNDDPPEENWNDQVCPVCGDEVQVNYRDGHVLVECKYQADWSYSPSRTAIIRAALDEYDLPEWQRGGN